MKPSVIKKASWAAPILLAFSSAAGAIDSGFFGETSLSQGNTDFRGTVSNSVLKEKTRPFVPPSMHFTMRSTECAEGQAGYRWNGGDTSVGSFSYTFSLSASGAVCDSRVFADLRFIKAYILERIDDAVRNAITNEIDDGIPLELRDLARDFGINPDPYLALVSDTIASYVLDLSQPIPENSEIIDAFDRLPMTSDPDVEDFRASLLKEVLDLAKEARRVRGSIEDVNNLPNDADGYGFMASVGFGGFLELRRHLSGSFLFNASPLS